MGTEREIEIDGVLVTSMVLMEAGPIDPSTNELAYGIATIVIGVLPVAIVVLAVLLTVRGRRQREARLSAVEQRLRALATARKRGES